MQKSFGVVFRPIWSVDLDSSQSNCQTKLISLYELNVIH